MSVSTVAIENFVAAQIKLVNATNSQLEAFADSAIAASVARSSKVTLQKLADANLAATAELAEHAPKGTLYVNLSSVTAHAFTGDVLRKSHAAVADGETVTELDAVALQSVILKANKAKGIGAKVVGQTIRSAKTQESALEMLKALKPAAEIVADDSAAEESEESSEVVESNEQTLETLLSRALKMISNGAEINVGARGLIAELATVLESAAIAA